MRFTVSVVVCDPVPPLLAYWPPSSSMAKNTGLAPKAVAMFELAASTAAVSLPAGAPDASATAWPKGENGWAVWPSTTLALPVCLPSTVPVALAETAVTRAPAAREVSALSVKSPLVPVVTVLALP